MTASKPSDFYHKALNQGYNPDQRLMNFLSAVLSAFSVNRVWLAYPGDTAAQYYEVPLEVVSAGLQTALEQELVFPITDLIRKEIIAVAKHKQTVPYHSDHPLVKELAEFNVKSMLLCTITPGFGLPWLFGAHQCTHARTWQQDEIALFTKIAHQIEDALASYLIFQELKQSEKQYRELFEQSHNGLVIFDFSRAVLELNHAFCDMLGYSAKEIRSIPFSRLIHLDSIDSFDDIFLSKQTAQVFRNEAQAVHKKGYVIDVDGHTCLINYQGKKAALMAIQDITSRKQEEQSQKRALAVQNAILDATVDGILVVDRQRKVIRYNQNYVDIWQIPLHILETSDAYQYLAKASEQMANPQQLISRVNAIYASPEKASDDVYQCLDGKVIQIYSRPFYYEQSIEGRVWSFRDITDAQHLSKSLNYQANHDSLTGLINRREFEKYLESTLALTRASHVEHVICYLDLDQFKLVNDSCGHAAGDELLKQLSQLMQSKIGSDDILARLGGDEFGLLMPHCSIEQAEFVAHALRKAIADYVYRWEHLQFNIAVSIGVAPINATINSVKEVLIHADAACYKAKNLGRNRIHIHQIDDDVISFHQQEMDRVALIQNALTNHTFQLWGQLITPVSNIAQGVHVEILLRLLRENNQILPPGAFLPTAERYNLAARIDLWVIEHALHWFSEDPHRLDQLHTLAINLSGQSLGDKNLLHIIKQIIQTTGFPASKLCFEITETAAIASLNDAKELIAGLKQEGCLFALDDFGSGLSSFAYLKNLPVDFLKIDGQFVCDLAHDPIDYAMVKSINEIGHVMGKKTIAEYVESKQILQGLGELGVDYAQGYYLGKPVPLAELFTQ